VTNFEKHKHFGIKNMKKLFSLTFGTIIFILAISFSCTNLNGKWLDKGRYLELDTLIGSIIKISRDGNRAYTFSDSTVYFYDLKKGDIFKSKRLKFSFSLDGDINDSGDELIFPDAIYYYNGYRIPNRLSKYLFDKDTLIILGGFPGLFDVFKVLQPLYGFVKFIVDDKYYLTSVWGKGMSNPEIEGGCAHILNSITDAILDTLSYNSTAITDISNSDNPKYFSRGGHYSYKYFSQGLMTERYSSGYSIIDSNLKTVTESASYSDWDIQNGSHSSKYGPQNLGDVKIHPRKDEAIFNEGTYKIDLNSQNYGKYAIIKPRVIDFSYSNNDKYLISIDSAVVRLHLASNFDIYDTINIQTNLDEYLWKIYLVRDSSFFYIEDSQGILIKIYVDSILSKFGARFTADNYNIKPKDSVSFVNLSPGDPTSFYWTFGDGSASTLENPVHQYKYKGKYTVRLMIFAGQKSDTLIKYDRIIVEEPNSIPLDYETSSPELLLSPNPATDFLEISYSLSNNHWVNHMVDYQDIGIYNVFGTKFPPRLNSSATPQEGNLRLDVSSLSPGVYFVKIGDNVAKFIKF